MKRAWVWVVALALSACSAVSVRPSVQEAVLDNGLRVLVKEDRRAPVVVTQVWYKVGASDEPDGLTGISHVLEHMMFKGTTAHPTGEFSRIIAANGGRENAFTGSDYTAYFQTLEKSRLPIAFELEADRMQNLTLDEKEFAKEIKVVMEERRLRTDDQPEGLAYERFLNTAFTHHHYRNPLIGWMRDLEKMTINDVRAWYRQWYVPNNATLVVVGDVDATQVLALARQTFGKVPARPLTRTTVPVEPPQTATRRSRVSVPAQVPSLLIGFHAPSLSGRDDDWEPYALMMLAGVLDGGASARFERELVRGSEVAAGVGVGYSPVARHPGLFVIQATPSEGQSLDRLEAVILAQLRRVRVERVSDAELERVKSQVTARDVFGRDSGFYQAMQMGMLETVGLRWTLADARPARLQAVTAEQVQAVAQKYLIEENMTVTRLEPQPGKKPKPARAAGGHHGR